MEEKSWIGTRDASLLTGLSEATIRRSLAQESWRLAWWGEQGDGWRLKGGRRTIYWVSRERAEVVRDNPPPVPK